MQTQELPLYQIREFVPETVSSKEVSIPKQSHQNLSLEAVLTSILPNQVEENKTSRMRKHLGEVANGLSDLEIETIGAEFQFLIDTWLDEFEKEVFKGFTLKEVLHKG